VTRPAIVSVESVHKAYGAHTVLDDVSLDVAEGEVVCVIGPSGAGKSTLIRCMNGLELHDHGRIVVDGTPVAPGQALATVRA